MAKEDREEPMAEEDLPRHGHAPGDGPEKIAGEDRDLQGHALGVDCKKPRTDLSGRKLGDYTLRERIGGGGNGDVYRAEHRLLRRVAVIKVMNEVQQCADDAEARFLREAQLASKVSHANAAHVYDFGVAEDGLMWLAMEFVDGITFAAWLDTHGPMSLAEVVPFFEPLAKVVDATHKCGIVHRDLKPSNVMVVETEGLQDPKLIDFGIAKGMPASLVEDYEPVEVPPRDDAATILVRAQPAPGRRVPTRSIHRGGPNPVKTHKRRITPNGCGLGSRAYMSPEQSRNASSVGPATDIYSLGVMIFEALTGRHPFTPSSADSPCLSPELEVVLYRALSNNPAHRHANARELIAELRAVLQADPNEQIRSLRQRWQERDRSPDLLARGQTLGQLKRSVQSPRVKGNLSDLDDSFITTSLRRARRARWGVGALVALVVMSVLLGRAEKGRSVANEFATQAEAERGQQALLHGESSEAVRHLEQAYQRGDHSPGVKFMLARALQPRLSELGRLTSSSGRMWSSVFSADGKRILTADDKSARMWDAGSNQLLFTMSHGDIVYQALFSQDGLKVITAGADGTVRIWNAATGVPVRVLTSHRPDAKQWRYYAVAMSSHFVAAIDTMGRSADVWDADTGTQIEALKNDASESASLALSPDGRWLATSGGDDVRVFDTSTWKQVVTIAGPRVRSLGFDPTGLRLAVGTYDGEASIWEVPSGVRVRCLRVAGEPVDAVAFSRDGALVATGSREGAEQVWDATSGGLRIEFNSHHSKIYGLEFSTTNNLLLSAGADNSAVVSNVATGMPVARLEGPKGFVFAAHFDPDSRRVVGASSDGTARVWDVTSPYRRWGSLPIGAECDTMESLEPDQRFIALSCRNHGTRVWDTLRGELRGELPGVTPVEGDYYSAFPALTVTGDRAAIAQGNTVEVYALPSGQHLRTIAHPAAVNAVAFAPAGHDLITGGVDGSLLLTRDDHDPIALPPSLTGIDAVAILADGRAVVADASNRLRVIDPSRNTLLMDVAAPSRMRLLRPSPDGTRLVTISARRNQAPPVLWNLAQYRIVAPLDGHVGRVFAARFVAAGNEILTAGVDGTARLWNAATGSSLQSYHGDSHFLVDATMAPDGSVIVAAGSDGMLRFWEVSSGRLLWMLQAHKSYAIGVHYEGGDIVTRGFAGDVSRWTVPQSDSIIEACRASACTSPTLAKK
jgi:WD40 repeat protein/serine/threonine protein kinase